MKKYLLLFIISYLLWPKVGLTQTVNDGSAELGASGCDNKCFLVEQQAYANTHDGCEKTRADCGRAAVDGQDCSNPRLALCYQAIHQCGVAYELCMNPANDAKKQCMDVCASGAQPDMEPNKTECQRSCQSHTDACVNQCPSKRTSDEARWTCNLKCNNQIFETDNGVLKCYDGCRSNEITGLVTDQECDGACQQEGENCKQSCQNSGTQAIQPPENTEPIIQPPAGVSSLNFRELSRANAEYQKAQSDLDKIKQANDLRWQAGKNFAEDYNSTLDRELTNSPLNQEDKGALEKNFEILRAKSEDIHEMVQKGSDLSELNKTSKKTKDEEAEGDYGIEEFGNDAEQTLDDYNNLRAKGVPENVALAKSTLDNFGTSALTAIPAFKAIDEVATAPDKVLADFGIDETNWWRENITKGIIGKFAPSNLVKQITDLMVENSWSDISDTLDFAIGKVMVAKGFKATAGESLKLAAALAGAGPVALARTVADGIGATMFVGESIVGFVSSLFTY